MEDVSGFIVIPVLTAVSGEDGVLHREHKVPAGLEPGADLLRKGGEVLQVVDGQGAEHHVEALRGEVHVLDSGVEILHLGEAGLLPGHSQHLFGQVHPGDVGGPVLRRVGAVPAVAAAQVQHLLAGKVRQKLLQVFPLPRAGQAQPRTAHLAVFLKK